jgi:hypothetical protein
MPGVRNQLGTGRPTAWFLGWARGSRTNDVAQVCNAAPRLFEATDGTIIRLTELRMSAIGGNSDEICSL